jgi:hypothetical protein
MWSSNSSCCGDVDHSDDITGNANANATEEGKDDAMRLGGHRVVRVHPLMGRRLNLRLEVE